VETLNETPFQNGFFIGTGPSGRPTLSIIVKATFVIPDRNDAPVEEAKNQIPLVETDEYYDDEMTGSIRIESDMVPFKPRADIVVVGNAYAPGKQPVKVLDAALRVGRILKNIRVFGDRYWLFPSRLAMIPVVSDLELFIQMPLVYERAFGGIDDKGGKWCKENLIGRGFIAKKSKKCINGKLLPNLEDPRYLINSWDSQPRPVGFGFYGRSWQPRVGYIGTMDEKWESEIAPEMPEDFRFEFYNGAHPDLQVTGYLHGNEQVEMKHLTPNGYCRFRLPGLYPLITIIKTDGQFEAAGPAEIYYNKNETDNRDENINVHLDTLVFIPDECIFYQVWRGLFILKEFDVEEIECIRIKLSNFSISVGSSYGFPPPRE